MSPLIARSHAPRSAYELSGLTEQRLSVQWQRIEPSLGTADLELKSEGQTLVGVAEGFKHERAPTTVRVRKLHCASSEGPAFFVAAIGLDGSDQEFIGDFLKLLRESIGLNEMRHDRLAVARMMRMFADDTEHSTIGLLDKSPQRRGDCISKVFR